jgi:hypothetical protein
MAEMIDGARSIYRRVCVEYPGRLVAMSRPSWRRAPKMELSMDKAEQDKFLKMLTNQYNAGAGVTALDLLRSKMELETADAQLRSAIASEKNAQYMLWSVVAAALSALASLASTIIAVFVHH